MAAEGNGLARSVMAPEAGHSLAPLDVESDRLSSLRDVPLQVEVRLGHARLSLGELLRLQAGSVLTLDRLVDEPADVLVGGRLVARGQIVAVGDELGVRVTELAPTAGAQP